ncbi:MAG TPA: hypothetical protein VGA73_11590, partial [Candidatus Binatia bacterium]
MALMVGYDLLYIPFEPELVFLAACLFAGSALAVSGGVLLGLDRRRGYQLSLAAQALQIPMFGSSAFSYALVFGFGAWLSFALSEEGWSMGVNYSIGELHQLYPGGGPEIAVGINAVALCFALLLWRTLARGA